MFGTSSDPMAPGHTHRTTLLTTGHRGGSAGNPSGRNTNKGSRNVPFHGGGGEGGEGGWNGGAETGVARLLSPLAYVVLACMLRLLT